LKPQIATPASNMLGARSLLVQRSSSRIQAHHGSRTPPVVEWTSRSAIVLVSTCTTICILDFCYSCRTTRCQEETYNTASLERCMWRDYSVSNWTWTPSLWWVRMCFLHCYTNVYCMNKLQVSYLPRLRSSSTHILCMTGRSDARGA
jgi:hypothetical protein